MGFCGFLCKKFIPISLFLIALAIGYVLSTPVPLGTFFSIVFRTIGFFNPEYVDMPADLTPKPRYENEIFFELPSGAKMPGIGLGLCCRPAAYDDESVRRMVLHFLLEGGRTLDTAHLYLNHKGVGQGIQDAIRAGIPREDIFVTTKIFPDHFGKKTEDWTEMILEELGLEYVDLVLLHSPSLSFGLFDPNKEFNIIGCKTQQECFEQTWTTLTRDRNSGLIRDIGVSNFQIKHLEQIKSIKDGAPIAVNQIQYNPWAPEKQKALVKYCIENNIVLTGYSSLGGLFNKEEALAREAILKIAKKHNKSATQVLLRWSLQSKVSVIPGTKSPKHMRENLEVYNFILSDEEMNIINNLGSDSTIYMNIN
eukprot:TRINITY_DN1085_c0_g1_i1.p1 TRINITY_DN1085_c0_g1~~TRINITY_DN1085_c0_g1_i1.p1  ORF type:complete len:366 (-),score=72.81 TRINITY_DN1085_c0_g1_i1:718-1815(-)